MLHRDLFVSIRPVHADKIIEGRKTVELRRRFAKHVNPGSLAYIYCTSPVQALVGYAIIKAVHRLPVGHIWRKHRSAACVSKAEFDLYFAGVADGFAIVLRDVRRFRKTIEVAQLRDRFGFVPPQSFRYVTDEYCHVLEHERIQATYRH